MPNASAPNAPCVLVWLSPQTMVLPGCVAPSSGPMMCTMPRRSSVRPIRSRPNSAQLTSSWRIWFAADSSAIGTPPNICARSVGVEWSMVTSVRSGQRTLSPRSRSTENAWGEVTSCVRCRSTYSTAGVSGVSGTTSCRSQTFWKSVLAVILAPVSAALRSARRLLPPRGCACPGVPWWRGWTRCGSRPRGTPVRRTRRCRSSRSSRGTRDHCARR